MKAAATRPLVAAKSQTVSKVLTVSEPKKEVAKGEAPRPPAGAISAVARKKRETGGKAPYASTAPSPKSAAEWVATGLLVAWPANPKKPTASEVQGVCESIQRFGFGAPIVARLANREIIAGHTRWKAATKLKLAEVPVRFLDLSENDAHLLALADNELGADWEPEALLAMLKELKDEERRLAGWSDEEFAKLKGEKGGIDGEDTEPGPLPTKPVSKPGERYELGPHVLVCGDSTEAASWDLLLGDERIDMVWTDPPYGVAYVGKTKDALTIENDKLDPQKLRVFLDALFSQALRHCAKGAAWYVASPAGPLFGVFGAALEALGVWKHTLTWVKDQFVLGRCDYHYRHEPIFYGWEPNGPHLWAGGRKLDSILEFARPKRSTEHPTMKPPELIQHCIANSSRPDAIVADACGGSGSTLIAAAREGRRARLIELDPKYCDVIRKRWGDFARSAGVDAGPGAL